MGTSVYRLFPRTYSQRYQHRRQRTSPVWRVQWTLCRTTANSRRSLILMNGYEWWRRTAFPRGSRTPVLPGTLVGLSSVFGMGTGGNPTAVAAYTTILTATVIRVATWRQAIGTWSIGSMEQIRTERDPCRFVSQLFQRPLNPCVVTRSASGGHRWSRADCIHNLGCYQSVVCRSLKAAAEDSCIKWFPAARLLALLENARQRPGAGAFADGDDRLCVEFVFGGAQCLVDPGPVEVCNRVNSQITADSFEI